MRWKGNTSDIEQLLERERYVASLSTVLETWKMEVAYYRNVNQPWRALDIFPNSTSSFCPKIHCCIYFANIFFI